MLLSETHVSIANIFLFFYYKLALNVWGNDPYRHAK